MLGFLSDELKGIFSSSAINTPCYGRQTDDNSFVEPLNPSPHGRRTGCLGGY
ncbi:hypothetical protein BFJ69_g14166 [Fusarium oxysporum]|uniref:Uncharacterized protein n=1 Tax=Fusarium oxysporum TaxID=5507 RepID=A0A420MID7_FUSOX|nr:hypothetical protein BFJ69_g14166 [Fusarium oxysporum]